MNTARNIKNWIHFNSDTIGMVFTMVIFMGIYFYFHSNSRQIDIKRYSGQVQLEELSFKKVYSSPKLYSTEIKLDKIVFNLIHF